LAGPGDARKQIQAQYDRWSKAYMANDTDTLLDILSPQYTLIDIHDDVMTYGAYKAYLKLRKGAPKDVTKYSTQIQKLTIKDPFAEVDAVESMVTVAGGHKVVHKHEYLDKWRLSGKVWRLEGTMTIKETTTKG
jgi:hypothetical protein